MASVTPRASRVLALQGVPYKVYVRLRDDPRNDHLRMTYFDGTLEVMSPATRHEYPSRRFGIIIYEIVTALGIECQGLRSTTFRKRGESTDKEKGKGKEPDECFYFANVHRIVSQDDVELDAGDPPPDLWIEIDNRSSSLGKLPLYAALGIPEVWRYRVRRKTLWFGRLVDGGYEPIERSLSLPMLTPTLVLEALALGEGISETAWSRRLRAWVAATFTQPPGT
jgi:Uma2 family endonuclease